MLLVRARGCRVRIHRSPASIAAPIGPAGGGDSARADAGGGARQRAHRGADRHLRRRRRGHLPRRRRGRFHARRNAGRSRLLRVLQQPRTGRAVGRGSRYRPVDAGASDGRGRSLPAMSGRGGARSAPDPRKRLRPPPEPAFDCEQGWPCADPVHVDVWRISMLRKFVIGAAGAFACLSAASAPTFAHVTLERQEAPSAPPTRRCCGCRTDAAARPPPRCGCACRRASSA